MKGDMVAVRREIEEVSSAKDGVLLSWSIEKPENRGRQISARVVYHLHNGDNGEICAEGIIPFNFPKRRVFSRVPNDPNDNVLTYGLMIRKARKRDLQRRDEVGEILSSALMGIDPQLSREEKCKELERIFIEKDGELSRKLKIATYCSVVYDVLQNPQAFE